MATTTFEIRGCDSNGFFDAAHSVRLNADRHVEITTKQQLEELVKAEKDGIAADAKLRKTFEAVEKLLHRNVSVRDFNAFISDREDIVPALSNIGNFKEQVWKSYIVKHRDAYDRLVQEIRDAAEKRKQIEEAARNERTAWQEVIDIFNSRFFVPFELSVQNLTSAVLEGELVDVVVQGPQELRHEKRRQSGDADRRGIGACRHSRSPPGVRR